MCPEPQLWGHYTYPARPSVSYVSTTSYLPPPGRFSSPFVSPFSGPLYRLEDVAGSYYYSQPSSSPSLRLSTSFGSQVSYVTPPDLYPRFSQSFSSTSFQGSDRWSSGLYPMIPVPRAGKVTGVEAQTNQPSINECYLCLPMGDPAKFFIYFRGGKCCKVHPAPECPPPCFLRPAYVACFQVHILVAFLDGSLGFPLGMGMSPVFFGRPHTTISTATSTPGRGGR